MTRFVTPAVFQVGYTTMDMKGLRAYLEHTGQQEFLDTINQAAVDGVEAAEVLVSTFAKLCYKSLIVGENANITQVRDIKGNLKGCQQSAHGSVFEHVSLNFIVTDCSRVFTHELVRHRVGIAFSQTSGRYCRIEPGKLELVFDPILKGCEPQLEKALEEIEKAVYLLECEKGLRKPSEKYPGAKPMDYYQEDDAGSIENEDMRWVPTGKEDGVNFDFKKKLTSAIRRIAPNGQSNEIAVSMNVRTLRHTIMMRTSRFSEWEIRLVFGEIYRICKEKWPLLFQDAKEREVDGLLEVYGMKMAPYERQLEDFEDQEMVQEIKKRIINGDSSLHTRVTNMLVDCLEVEKFDNKLLDTAAKIEERVRGEMKEAMDRTLKGLGIGDTDEFLAELKESGIIRVMLPASAKLQVGDKFPCRFPDMEKLAVVTAAAEVSAELMEVEMKLTDKSETDEPEEANDD